MGLLWASRLCQAQLDVRLIVRHTTAKQPTTPATLDNASIDFIPYQAIDKLTSSTATPTKYLVTQQTSNQLTTNQIQQLILCVKAYDIDNALAQISSALAPNACLIIICNGMGFQTTIEQRFKQRCPNGTLYWGLSNEGAIAKRLTATHYQVTQTGIGDVFIGPENIGPGNISSEKSPPVQTAPNEKGIDKKSIETLLQDLKHPTASLQFIDQISRKAWDKFFINCAINPLTAFYACRNGELLTNTAYRQHFDTLLDEVLSISGIIDTQSFTLSLTAVSREQDTTVVSAMALKERIIQVVQKTAKNHSSMWHDFKNQTQNELDFLNQYLLNIAQRFEKTLPVNQRLIKDLQAKGFNAAKQTLNH